MGAIKWCVSATFVLLVAIISYPIISIYSQLKPGQQWAALMTHNVSSQPKAEHARYRYHNDGYDKYPNVFHFQWWNYLIVDAETNDHFTIVYHLANFPDNVNETDYGMVGLSYLRGPERRIAAGERIPLDQVIVGPKENGADLTYPKPGSTTGETYTQTFVDANTYHLTASLPAERCRQRQAVTWDVTFYRVHGVYMGQDLENSNDKSICNFGGSTLYGYNVEVDGTVTIGKRVYTFTRSSRYRGYAAGSWGCDLPAGTPAIDYPWSWFWLVVPSDEVAKTKPVDTSSVAIAPPQEPPKNPPADLSIVFGDGRFQRDGIIQDIYGSWFMSGLPPYANDIVTARFGEFRHNASFHLPVMASSSDGFVRRVHVDRDEWTMYTDEFGEALIPLRQTFTIETENYRFFIDFKSKLEQYFRLVVGMNRDGSPRLYSDFRAVGVATFVRVTRISPENSSSPPLLGRGVVYEGSVNSLNALEYAYEPPMAISYWEISRVASSIVSDEQLAAAQVLFSSDSIA